MYHNPTTLAPCGQSDALHIKQGTRSHQVCKRAARVRERTGRGAILTKSCMPAAKLTSVNISNVLSIIMGGGQGTRLFPLTRERSKPAVPLAGKYRLVDIPISNCINSGLKR